MTPLSGIGWQKVIYQVPHHTAQFRLGPTGLAQLTPVRLRRAAGSSPRVAFATKLEPSACSIRAASSRPCPTSKFNRPDPCSFTANSYTTGSMANGTAVSIRFLGIAQDRAADGPYPSWFGVRARTGNPCLRPPCRRASRIPRTVQTKLLANLDGPASASIAVPCPRNDGLNRSIEVPLSEGHRCLGCRWGAKPLQNLDRGYEMASCRPCHYLPRTAKRYRSVTISSTGPTSWAMPPCTSTRLSFRSLPRLIGRLRLLI